MICSSANWRTSSTISRCSSVSWSSARLMPAPVPPMPAASPRVTTSSAILRDASSIIWPSCMTAPLRSTWVAWW